MGCAWAGNAGNVFPTKYVKWTASERSRHASWHVRYARAVMHVGIANPRCRGKPSRHSRRMCNQLFYISGKRPIASARNTRYLARSLDPKQRIQNHELISTWKIWVQCKKRLILFSLLVSSDFRVMIPWGNALDLTDDKSSVQIMASCRRPTSHHPIQSWHSSMSLFADIRSQFVNDRKTSNG